MELILEHSYTGYETILEIEQEIKGSLHKIEQLTVTKVFFVERNRAYRSIYYANNYRFYCEQAEDDLIQKEGLLSITVDYDGSQHALMAELSGMLDLDKYRVINLVYPAEKKIPNFFTQYGRFKQQAFFSFRHDHDFDIGEHIKKMYAVLNEIQQSGYQNMSEEESDPSLMGFT